MIIIWRGCGLLVPAIWFGCVMLASSLIPEAAGATMAAALGSLFSTVILATLGTFLRKRDIGRHLYFIPMEFWAVPAFLISVMGFWAQC